MALVWPSLFVRNEFHQILFWWNASHLFIGHHNSLTWGLTECTSFSCISKMLRPPAALLFVFFLLNYLTYWFSVRQSSDNIIECCIKLPVVQVSHRGRHGYHCCFHLYSEVIISDFRAGSFNWNAPTKSEFRLGKTENPQYPRTSIQRWLPGV